MLDEAGRVCDWLDGHSRFTDIEYIHFARQIDYAEIDGQRLVTALFPVNRTDALSSWIADQTEIRGGPKTPRS